MEKVFWDDLKKNIKKIDSQLEEIISSLSPGNDYPLYISSYNYGEMIGDHFGLLLKDSDNNPYRLGSDNTPKEIMKDLGYGKINAPLMMILDKQFEWEVFDQRINLRFPIYIEKPGYFIGIKSLLEHTPETKTYLSSSIMLCSAGSRNTFMLPNIGNQRNHDYLQRKLNIDPSPPKNYSEHWRIFQQLSAKDNSCSWKAKALIFSRKWVDSLKNDPEWIHLKQYLTEKMVLGAGIDKNKFFYDLAFSRAEKLSNNSCSTYTNEVCKHLFGIALGNNIGFKPAEDSIALPLTEIQNIYRDIYKIKQTPVIMEPATAQTSNKPVYYSLQTNTLTSAEKKNKNESRALSNLIKIEGIMKKYINAFNNESPDAHFIGTTIHAIAKSINISYHHYQSADSDNVIKGIQDIIQNDCRFNCPDNTEETNFPYDAKFSRGCFRIKTD